MLKIVANKENKRYKIGVGEKSFDEIADIDLFENLHGFTGGVECEVTEILQIYGATTSYYDLRKDKYVSKKDYDKHFIDYNSDESYILAYSVFESYNEAVKCIEHLQKYL